MRQSSGTTQYTPELTQKYAKLKKDMHYFYDGFQSTVLSQLDAYNETQSDISNTRVIDIACGDGNYTRLLSDKYDYQQIVGVDISPSQIDLAQQMTDIDKYSNVSYQCLDGSTFHIEDDATYKEQFDIALAIWFYNYARF